MATRGPQTSFVRDSRGDPVVGLRIHKRKPQRGKPIEPYYALLPDGPRKYFGSSLDKTDAIFQFRQWEARQSKELVDITVQSEPQPSITKGWGGASHYVRLQELQGPKQGPLEWHRIPADAL